MSGKLFVVATPLGNLDDLSPRALEALRTADAVACEDTRHTAKLLARYGIDVPTFSCHKFNEGRRIESILDRLRAGATIVLVSDGGTPGVSDPGALLVGAALDEGITVSPLPGPSAATALISASGLPADRYVFEGFLPPRAGERRRRLRQLATEERTVVIFEAPHRLIETLEDVEEVLGDRRLVLGRELTKIHETILAGTARELRQRLGPNVKGEVTIVMAGRSESDVVPATDTEAKRILDCWHEALEEASSDRRVALRRAAKTLGLRRSELHRRLAELGEGAD